MTTYQADWQAAKKAFFKVGLTGQDVPGDIIMSLSQGKDFGPALKKFDAAKTFETRLKAAGPALKASTEYGKDIIASLKGSSTAGKKALQHLQTEMNVIMRQIQRDTQPPRPSGRMVSPIDLKEFNLLEGIKAECLVFQPVKIKVTIEVDAVFMKMVDAGEIGFRVMVLTDAAQDEAKTLRADFADAIAKVDANIKKDPSILKKKTVEANEVLKYYGKLAEDRIVVAVRNEWEQYLSNKQHLKDFQVKTGVKVVLGTIGASVALASAILSFGTAWMNIVAAVKGFAEVAKTIHTATLSIDEVRGQLNEDLRHVDELNEKREKAKKAGKGQKASKAKEAGKELLAGLLPLTKDMMKVRSGIEARVNHYSGLISQIETAADKVSGQLFVVNKSLAGLPKMDLLSAPQRVEAQTMTRHSKKLSADLVGFLGATKEANKFAAKTRKAVQELKAKDSWTAGLAENTAGYGTIGAAAFAGANFIYECASAGKALIPM